MNSKIYKIRIPDGPSCIIYEPYIKNIIYPSWKNLDHNILNGLSDFMKDNKIVSLFLYIISLLVRFFIAKKFVIRHNYNYFIRMLKNKKKICIFSHGLGACADLYKYFCSNLSKRGNLVIAVTHESGDSCYTLNNNNKIIKYTHPPKWGKRVPDNTCLHNLNCDINNHRYRIKKFREPFLNKRINEINNLIIKINNINKNKILLIGHSFGGITMLKSSSMMNKYIKGCVVFDPWMEVTNNDLVTNCKTIIFRSKHWNKNIVSPLIDEYTLKNLNYVDNIYNPNVRHQYISDCVYWFPKWIGKLFNLVGDENPDKTINNILDHIDKF